MDPIYRSVEEYTSPEEDLLLRKYYADNFQFRSLIESFDRFLSNDYPKCWQARKIQLGNGNFSYVHITRILQPTYEDDYGVHKLRPEIALLEDRTYAVEVRGVVRVIDAWGERIKGVEDSREFFVQHIPIPVYSAYCYYSWIISDNPTIGKETLTPPSGRTLKTKSPEDPGCSFIIAGTRNVILHHEKGRFNQYQVHIDLDSPQRLPYLCIISESPHSTSSTYLYMDSAQDSLYVGVKVGPSLLAEEDEQEEGTEIVVPEKTNKKVPRPASVNVLHVAYVILSVGNLVDNKKPLKPREVQNRFVQKLREIIPREQYSKCYSVFAATVLQYQSLSEDQIFDILHASTKIPKPSGRQGRMKAISDLWIYFRDQMFPNWTSAEEKFSILVMATSRLLLTRVGHLKVTDRNHWATRSLHGPGPMIMGVMRRLISKLVEVTQGKPNFTSVVSAEGVSNVIEEELKKLSSRLIKSFKPPNSKMRGGLAKKPHSMTMKAIAIDASPINTEEMRNILGKTRNNAFKENPVFRNRSVEGSFWKMLCSYLATEDDRCGHTKFLALMTYITSNADDDPYHVRNILLRKLIRGMNIIKREYVKDSYNIPVTINGLPIGYASKYGYSSLRMLKRYGIIPVYSCIVMTAAGVLEIYVDAHRLMIPVVTCDEDSLVPSIFLNPDWKTMSSRQLVAKGYIEFMDNYEIENEAITLAQTYASFTNYIAELSKRVTAREDAVTMKDRDPVYEKNLEAEIQSILAGRPNTMALHPIGSFGITAAMLTFQHQVQSCRISYANKMRGQVILDMLDNPYEHSKSYTSASKTIATVDTHIQNIVGLKGGTGGGTATVAIVADPLNQEDAAIVNRRHIELGGFRYTRTMIFRDTLEDKEEYGRVITGQTSYVMRHIGENGMPATGVRVKSGDCILGKYRKEGTSRVDASTYLYRDEEGVVSEVVTYYSVKAKNQAKKLTVSIKITLYSKLEEGDKTMTRHSQKYIANIRSDVDMPWNENFTATVCISPACLPTRMTAGTVLEPILGLATALGGRMTDIAGHRDYNAAEITETLKKNGYNSRGTQMMYLGTTGVRIRAEIFVGLQRVNQLAHIAEEKIQCRATGRMGKVNRQAEASKYGETRNKGQKIGEPERNQLIKYGASFVIEDRMNISCDGVTIVVCKICSSYASYDRAMKSFSCPKCGVASLGETETSRFGKFIMPQTARYTHLLMASLGVLPKPKFVTREVYLGQPITADEDAGEVIEADANE